MSPQQHNDSIAKIFSMHLLGELSLVFIIGISTRYETNLLSYFLIIV